MLGYLDALIAALSVRDSAEAQRLLTHPLAKLLPADVVSEATAFVAGTRDPLAAPLRTMQLRYQTAELLREAPPAADAAELADTPRVAAPPTVPPTVRERRAPRQPQQIELPLSA